MPIRLPTRVPSLAMAVAGLACASQADAVTFSDTTFAPASLTIETTVLTNATYTTSQILTGGNPGAAFQFNVSAGAGNSHASILVWENAFIYDTALLGAASSISFSIDSYATTSLLLGSNGASIYIKQGDKLFSYSVSLPSVEGVYQTAGASGLTAASFIGANSSHPDFSSGTLQFGFAQGWIANGFPANTFTGRVDNFIVNVSSVPEGGTALLLALGLLGLHLRLRRTDAAGEA